VNFFHGDDTWPRNRAFVRGRQDRVTDLVAQKGTHAVQIDGGGFSPVMYTSTYEFHRRVARQVLNVREKPKRSVGSAT